MRKKTVFGALAVAAGLVSGALAGIGAPASAQSVCSRPAAPGRHTIDVVQGGVSRPVPVWVPAGYRGAAVPLLLSLHGSSQSGEQTLATEAADGSAYLTDDADQHGYVLAAPTGGVPFAPMPGLEGWTWNIPGVPLVGTARYPEPTAPDDVEYLGLVIDAVSRQLCIDAERVYAAGTSGGGRMASQLACDLPHRIAAIAPVMGVRVPQATDHPPRTVGCPGGRPVPTLAVHGVLDPINQFGNDDPRITPGSSWTYGVPEALRRRAAMNGCDTGFPDHAMVSANVRHWSFRCPGGAAVELLQVLDGGHTVPGGAEIPSLAPIIGPTNRELDTPDAVWGFLSRFSL